MRPVVPMPWWMALLMALLSILVLVPWMLLRLAVELARAVDEALRHRPT